MEGAAGARSPLLLAVGAVEVSCHARSPDVAHRRQRPSPPRTMNAPRDNSLVTGPKGIQVHLVDGTYELFRHFFGAPPRTGADGTEVGAVRGVLSSVLMMLGDGATHVGGA